MAFVSVGELRGEAGGVAGEKSVEKMSSARLSSALEVDTGAPLEGRGMREGIELRGAVIVDANVVGYVQDIVGFVMV